MYQRELRKTSNFPIT